MPLTNSHEIIKRICAALFSAEERRLAKVRESLIKANREYYPGRPHDGFTYQGVPYDPAGLARGPRVRVPLYSALTDQMDGFLKDTEQVWSDRHHISQVLFTILQPCSDNQDLRDALPECLVDTLSDLKRLNRSREPAFTVQNNTRTVRQFHKVLPRMEFYATARMLY